MDMLNKTFSPAETETRLYEGWEGQGAFAAHPGSAADPFTIMIPPPNVTGSLHMGHALTFTIQDTLIRRARSDSFLTGRQPTGGPWNSRKNGTRSRMKTSS